VSEAILVRVVGAGDATVVVADRAVVVRAGDRELAFPIASLDGVRAPRGDERALAIHAGGRVIELAPHDDAADAFDAFVRAVVREAFALPEVMRGLRAYGSRRARPGADHDRFFAPLVTPLRALRAAHDRASGGAAAWRACEALDATRAGAELRAALAAIAAERHRESAPDRRALEAELEDEAEELFARLDALTAAAQRLHTAPDAERVAAWRAWTAALTATFDAADRCWSRAVPALGAAG
jgi:hypothetical protein